MSESCAQSGGSGGLLGSKDRVPEQVKPLSSIMACDAKTNAAEEDERLGRSFKRHRVGAQLSDRVVAPDICKMCA